MSKSIPRRTVLKGLGGVALSLPILPSILPSRAAAALGAPPLRFVAIQSRDGTFESEFWPKDPTQQLSTDVWGHRLSTINGPLSNVLGTSFDRLRNKISVIRGLDYLHFAFHRSCAPFGAAENPSGSEQAPPITGSTIDCIIENSPNFYKTPPSVRALRISSQRACSSWRPAGGRDANISMMPYFTGSKNVFNALFAKPQTSSSIITPNMDQLILAQVNEQFKEFIKQRGLSSLDRDRVQTAADLVNDLQKKILSGAGKSGLCKDLQLINNEKSHADRYTDYIDSIAAAFACDLTRVCHIFLGEYQDIGGAQGTHHANSHETKDSEIGLLNCRTWDGWQAKQVASLMQKLDSIIESDGSTVLDNTVIVWANEDGIGSAHSSYSIPCVVGGGARGRLRMGHYLDYRKRPFVWNGKEDYANRQAIGALWPSFLISIMQAVGVTPEEFLRQGDDGFGQFSATNQFTKIHPGAALLRKSALPFFYSAA